ncbi:MAG: hypothetical protein IJ068_07130 [Bacilli bacterium]|nr:hypothetical protein [Bacilli bacterium]
MNNLKELSNKYTFKVNKIEYKNKVIIIDTNTGKYVYKDNNNYKTYEYLMKRGFSYFPKPINSEDTPYEIVPFINEQDVDREQKANDLINIVSFLHQKTFSFKEMDLDELKKMYEKMQDDANYLMSYYSDINEIIDNTTFMSPAMYLLVRNIDLFYYLITFIKIESTTWYNEIKNKKNIRYVMLHNNLDSSHLLENNSSYLISWDKAHIGLSYIDLRKILEDNYYYLDIEDVLEDYVKNNKLSSNEQLFLLLNLAMVKKFELSNDVYLDCYKLNNYIGYLRKIALIVQKYDKKVNKN